MSAEAVTLPPAPGRFVEVDGVRLHVRRQGAGQPTVVFQSGRGEWSTSWALVQRRVHAFTSTAVWDRPGLGWSEPDSEPRTLDRLVDLHRGALEAAGVSFPVVLVGHSLGGLMVRRFAQRWPHDVVGLVLVDPTSENHRQDVLPFPLSLLKPLLRRAGNRSSGEAAAGVKTPELEATDLQHLPTELVPVVRALLDRPEYAVAAAHEGERRQSYIDQVKADPALPCTDLPLVVISSSGKEFADLPLPVRALGFRPRYFTRLLHEGHRLDAQKLSSRGRWLVARGTTHAIPQEAPELVADAIREVVEAARERSGRG